MVGHELHEVFARRATRRCRL